MASEASLDVTGRRLLVVEDEFMIAMDVASWLESKGAEVIGPAASVDDALALLGTNPPVEAAVLDINLGDERVYPVADALQAAGVPFIFMSGYDASVIPERYKSAARCTKPLVRYRLLRALSEALEG